MDEEEYDDDAPPGDDEDEEGEEDEEENEDEEEEDLSGEVGEMKLAFIAETFNSNKDMQVNQSGLSLFFNRRKKRKT